MNVSAFARRPLRAAPAAPIKAYTRRGFIIGWIAITAVAAASYALAASQLSPTSANLHLANIAGNIYPVFAPE